MKTILVTGGTSGIGKALAMRFLKRGDRVIAIGSSSANGAVFCQDAHRLGAGNRAVFMQANLS